MGGAIASVRVARALGEQVVRMDHLKGFRANLATAVLVGLGVAGRARRAAGWLRMGGWSPAGAHVPVPRA